MLGDGGKVKDFAKRTLVDAGSIYDDHEEHLLGQGQETTDQLASLPLPNMLIDGVLVTGGDDEDNLNMQKHMFGLDNDSDSNSDSE